MRLIRKTLMTFVILAAAPLSAASAQGMSEADRRKLIENILEADADKNGALTQGEFETLIRLNAADNLGRAKLVVRAGAYGKAFNRLDKNSDGAVTREEMQELAEQRG